MSSDASLFVTPPPSAGSTEALFAPDREARSRRRRRRIRRIVVRTLLVLVALTVSLLAALPAVLSTDLVRSSFVKRLNRAVPDSVVEIRDWTWRWFAPCRVDGFAVRKRDQSVAFSLESATSSKGLAAWFGFRQDFGVVTLDQPVLTVMELPEPVASAAAVPGPKAPRGAASPPVAPQAAPSARRVIPFALNPFGQFRVTNGKAEAFPREAPIVRITRIEATATLAGLAGPVAVAASSSLPQSQGMNGTTNAAITLSATLSSLRSALADPTAAGVEATLDVPPVDLTAVEAFLPASPSRPRIGSGRFDATLALRRGADASLDLTGRVRTRGVRLSDGALAPDRLAWEEAGLTLSLQQRPGEIAIRELRLESPFVAVQASGNLRTEGNGANPGGTLVSEGQVDLATLGAQLPSKLHLRPGVSIRRGVVRFDAEAATQATGLHVFALLRCDGVDAVRDGRPLRVELPITLGLNADLASAGEPRHATLALKSAPVTLTLEGDATKGTAVGDADLGALHAALSPLLELGPEPAATGLLALRGGWRDADGGLAVDGDFLATRLRVVRSAAASLELPTAKVAATALFPRKDGAVDPSRVQRLSLEAAVPFATAKFAADEVLPRQGVARGFVGSLDAELAPLLDAAGAGGGTPIAERLVASLSGDLDPDEVRMREFAAAAGAFDLKGSGTLLGLTGERRLDVAATLGVDFDRLQPVVTQRVEGVVLSGRSVRQLQLSAPLGGGRAYLLSALKLDSGVVVDRLAALGMVARQAVVDVRANDGQLAIRASATVNEGRFQLAPAIDLLATPPMLTLPPKSRVLDDAQLTQEMLEQQLARIHPILRGCSVSSGRVSVDMADFAMPVVSNAAQRMAWTAQFTLRDARLAAAGALADAADALRLRHKEVLITNQTLVVSCRNGRFYPQPLDLTIDGHALRVAGSVGLDGSLDYAVEIPLTEALVGEEAHRYLRGQTVRIPVSGTASKPRLDAAAIQSEIRRLVASIAARVAAEKLQDELRGQLRDRARDFDAGKLEDALRRLRP